MKIILASKSPRRKQLMNILNIPYSIIPSTIDESTISSNGKSSSYYCQLLASMKSAELSSQHPDAIIIGGDTIVVIDERILEKPKNTIEAITMLKALSGKTHQVYTGISIQCKSKNIECTFSEKTSVTFHDLPEKDIIYYVNSYLPFDKAGGYGIQDWSALFVTKIDGCFYNVVGFPISRIYKELKNLKDNKIFLGNLLKTKLKTS